MKTYYKVKNMLKHAEEDHPQDGCIGNGFTLSVTVEVVGPTIAQVIKEACEFLGLCEADMADAVEINACGDDTGRVDVAVMEKENGWTASERELEAWRAGLKRMWYCVYTFHVIKITEEAVVIPEDVLCGVKPS